MEIRLSLLIGFLCCLLSCQTPKKTVIDHGDELGFGTTHELGKDFYYLNLGFICEPERDVTYKKRTGKLVNLKAVVIFYQGDDKVLSQAASIINNKILFYSLVDKIAFEKTQAIELEIRNTTITVNRERLSAPITLPNSICD